MFIRKKDGRVIGKDNNNKVKDYSNDRQYKKEKEKERNINVEKLEMYQYVDYIDIELYVRERYNEASGSLYASFMERLCAYLKNVCFVSKVRYKVVFSSQVNRMMMEIEGTSYDYEKIHKDIITQYNLISKNKK